MSKKIFIIEDDANVLYALQAKFRVDGYEVETENDILSIDSIFDKIKAFGADFIVLDLILPRIDGFTLLKALKEDQAISRIPICIFTNMSDEDSKAIGLRLGAQYFFVKNNFIIDEFVSKVKKIIENNDKSLRS